MPWRNEWEELDVIGQGGQGVVTKLKHKTKPGKYAVLKTLLKRCKDQAQARERLNREAETLKKLHPAGAMVPEVYSSFDYQDKSSAPFLLMEFIPGILFENWIEQSAPVDVNTGVKITKAIAKTIELCHENDIGHRDLKPGNIIFKNSNVAEPYVLDFGISFDSMQNVTITKDGETFRNEFITLPEGSDQIGGHQDLRSDITSLVGIFFTCICGKKPLVLLDSQNQPPHMRFADLISKKILDPEQRQQVKTLFGKGFEYSIVDRFQTMQEFKQELNFLIDSTTMEKLDFFETFKSYDKAAQKTDRNVQLAKLKEKNKYVIQMVTNGLNAYMKDIGKINGEFLVQSLPDSRFKNHSFTGQKGDDLSQGVMTIYGVKRKNTIKSIYILVRGYAVGMQIDYYSFVFSGSLDDFIKKTEYRNVTLNKITTLSNIDNTTDLSDVIDAIISSLKLSFAKGFRKFTIS